jgi:hypothetical protein
MVSVERIKRACIEICQPESRSGVRFVGPKNRRFSTRLTVENLEGANLGKLCAAVFPAMVFLRQTTGADITTASRIDVYIPGGAALHLFIAYRTLYMAAFALAAGCAYLLSKKV